MPVLLTSTSTLPRVCSAVLIMAATSANELVVDCAAPIEIVGRFLALLELYRARAVAFDQSEPLGVLQVSWTGDRPTSEHLSTADAVEELLAVARTRTTVVRDGRPRELPPEEVVQGDQLDASERARCSGGSAAAVSAWR